MPTQHPIPPRRPYRPQRATPTLRRTPLTSMIRLVALSTVVTLANFSWTSTYRPDQHHTPDRDTIRADPAEPAGPDPDHHGPVGGDPDDTDTHDTDTHDADNERRASFDEDTGDERVAEDEETAAARRFATAALDGRCGEAYQQAAQTAVAIATEHDFADDPKRVADAVVVFLHPDHR